MQDLSGELLAASDAMWSQHQQVALAVFAFMNAQQAQWDDPQRRSLMKLYDEQRAEAMQSANRSTSRAREIVGTLSLICPDLEASATEWVQASTYSGKSENPLPTKEQEERRARARVEFIEKTRAVLGT